MKNFKVVLSTLTAAAMLTGLTGCGGVEDIPDAFSSQTQSVPARMDLVYSPAGGDLPLPNDLLFNGSSDLTLNLPAADPTDFSDPLAAAGTLDGWSATAPISMTFNSSDPGVSLNASSVVGGDTIRVYKVNTLRSEVVPGTGIISPTGPVTSIERELVPNLEYVVVANGPRSVAIIPTAPLEQQAGYMVVATNGLSDSDGEAILNDAEFAIVKSTSPLDPNTEEGALEPVRELVNAMITATEAFGGPSRSETIVAFQFTVQSVGAVMQSAKLAIIDGPLAAGATPALSFSSLFTDTTPFTGIGAADLYKGSIALNYLLGVPSVENPTAPLNTFWRAAEQLPLGPGGALVPNPLLPVLGDFLTYANSFPGVNSVETAPLLVSMPKAALCPKPANGYPVAIFQHGITSNRTAALGIMDAMAAPPSCRAVVSMDQPLHGISANDPVHLGLQAASGGAIGLFEGYTAGGLRERTMGVDYLDNTTGAPGPDGIADSSGAHTINLANLLVARDNLRQATLDLLYLEKAIAFMDVDGGGTDFDATNITFAGHSLGGIVGSNFVAYSDLVQAAALVNPGSGIAGLLDASLTFGPRIRGGIAAAAGTTVDAPEFPALYAQFLFAAQTVIDPADPANTAAFALVNDVPTLMMQNLNDSVVPNSVATAPLSGTVPMARVLETVPVAASAPGQVVGSRLFSRLNSGLHATLLTPAGTAGPTEFLNVTTEMQTQVVSFFASGGAALVVSDPSLLD